MGVLAEVREKLKAQEDVLVTIRPRLDFAMVMVMVPVAAASRGGYGVGGDRRPDRVLSPGLFHRTHPALSSSGGQERPRNLARSGHGKVSGSRPGCPLACARETVSSPSWGAVERTWSSRRRTHCKVIVRLEGHDPVLHPNARHYPLVVDDDMCVRW